MISIKINILFWIYTLWNFLISKSSQIYRVQYIGRIDIRKTNKFYNVIISLLSIQCWQNEHLPSILLYSCYMNIKEILYSYARYILASSEKEFYFLRTKCTLMIQNMIHSKYSNISFLRQYTISWYPANLNLYKFLKLNLYFKLMNKNLINLYPHHDIKNKFGISI